MNTKELLFELCALPAVSGREYLCADKVREILSRVCDETRLTPLGTVIGIRRCCSENSPLILLDGHLDQIGGFVVGYEGRFLRITGTFDPRFLQGKTLTVCSEPPLRAIAATNCLKEPEKLAKIEDLLIDPGLDEEEVKKIRLGTQVVYEQTPVELAGGLVSLPSVDDRSAIAAALLAAEGLDRDCGVDLAISASAGEEVGGYGALTAGYQLKPDYAIACDVSFARQTGFEEEFEEADDEIGIARGPHMNRRLTDLLISLAERENIKTYIEVEPEYTGTNTSEIRVAGGGIACGLVGLPIRYMHQNVETIRLSVIESAALLMRRFAEAVGGGALC